MAATRIIAIEGIDGSGKTVQAAHLGRALAGRGLRVKTLSFPVYQSFFGGQVGKYLSGAEGVLASEVDQKSMALWFAMDRFDALRGYRDGEADVLLINRYVLSNAVYQSIRERDLNRPDMLEFVLELEHGRLGLPEPDVYVYLDVEAGEAEANVLRKGHRDYVGDKQDAYEAQGGIQRRAREKYLEYARRLPNILVVSCMRGGVLKSEAEIGAQVLEAIDGASIL